MAGRSARHGDVASIAASDDVSVMRPPSMLNACPPDGSATIHVREDGSETDRAGRRPIATSLDQTVGRHPLGDHLATSRRAAS